MGNRIGHYEIRLRFGESAISVFAEVLPVRLEPEDMGVWLWANETGHTPYAGMLPFVYEDRAEQETAYRNEVGTNVYWDWPAEGTVADWARRQNPDTYFMIHGLGGYEHRLYTGDLKPEDITPRWKRKWKPFWRGISGKRGNTAWISTTGFGNAG